MKTIILNPEFASELVCVIPYTYWLHQNNQLEKVITSKGMSPFYYFCDDVEERFDHRTFNMETNGLSDVPNDWIHHNAKVVLDKNYFLSVKTKVLDGRIFITGKIDNPEEKLKITKLAWETKGARSVKNDLRIKEKFNFKQSAKDLLITSQLRTALVLSKKIKSANYNIDTYKKKIYVYGIAQSENERRKIWKNQLMIQKKKIVMNSKGRRNTTRSMELR